MRPPFGRVRRQSEAMRARPASCRVWRLTSVLIGVMLVLIGFAPLVQASAARAELASASTVGAIHTPPMTSSANEYDVPAPHARAVHVPSAMLARSWFFGEGTTTRQDTALSRYIVVAAKTGAGSGSGLLARARGLHWADDTGAIRIPGSAGRLSNSQATQMAERVGYANGCRWDAGGGVGSPQGLSKDFGGLNSL